jgi:outer membrane receptor protein involved in Fe transport
MGNLTKKAYIAAGGMAVLMLFVSDIQAQVIENIVVTARKREETLQEVPLSVTAFNTQGLRDRNVDNVYDLATFTPNFNFNRNIVGRRLDAPNIRGQFSPLLGQSNAAFFIDGVFISGTSSTLAIENLERVEVLRGPQAATFGRATFAGAVNLITKAPSNEFEGEVNLRAGQDDDYKLGAWVSGPIVEDKLLFLASGSYETWGGEWKNQLVPCQVGLDPDTHGCTQVNTDLFDIFGTWPADSPPPSSVRSDFTDLGGEETWNLTGKLSWTPTDNVTVTVKASYGETDDDHYAVFFQDELNCFGPGPIVDDPDTPGMESGVSPGWYCGELKLDGLKPLVNIADIADGATSIYGTSRPAPFVGTQSQTWRYLAELRAATPDGWDVLARYSRNDQEVQQYRDLDRGPALGPAYINVFDAGETDDFTDDSVEFRLASPGENRVRGSAGLYYYDSDTVSFQRDFTGVCRFNFGDPRLVDDGAGGFREVYEGDASYAGARKSPIADGHIENRAIYGTLEIDILDTLTFGYETRYAKDTAARSSPRGAFAEENFYSFTPRYTLTYAPSNDVTVYGKLAKGTKPGGLFFAYFDVDVQAEDTQAAIDDGRALFDEEKAWTYEIGAKTSWLDRRLIANASVFYIDWTSQGINEVDLIPTDCNGVALEEPNNVLTNAGKSRVYGLELDLQYAVTDNLFVSLAYGLQDTKLEEFNSLTYADLTGISDPDLVNGGNVSGNEAPRVPKHNVVASAVYRRPFWEAAEWFLRSDYRYESEQWVTAVNEAKLGDLQLWNLRLGIETDAWQASIYADNLLDDDTPALVSDFPNFSTFPTNITTTFPLQPRRGRNFGVTVQYRFGER